MRTTPPPLIDHIPPGMIFVRDQWIATASGRFFPTYSPATGEILGHVPLAEEADVDRAIRAAQEAAPVRAGTPWLERATRLRALAAALRRHRDELAPLDAVNSGNVIASMRRDVKCAAATLEYFAGLIPEFTGETIPTHPAELAYTVREPFGVVAKINAYNHPLRLEGSRSSV